MTRDLDETDGPAAVFKIYVLAHDYGCAVIFAESEERALEIYGQKHDPGEVQFCRPLGWDPQGSGFAYELRDTRDVKTTHVIVPEENR